jgi:hypothetical protein
LIDKYGYEVENHELRNIPLLELYPDEEIILIQ